VKSTRLLEFARHGRAFEAVLNRSAAVLRCSVQFVTLPSRWTCIPTWGREQARNRFVRGGLFIICAPPGGD